MKCLKAIFPFLFLGPFLANTQVPSYIHYEIRDGLPSNLVYCCYQDRQGLMWFGTDKGLANFDGVRFKSFGTDDGLTDTEIIGLWEDSRNRLWVANFGRQPFYRFDGRFHSSINDTILSKMPSFMPYKFSEDKVGNIRMCGLKSEIYVISDKKYWTEKYPDAVSNFQYIGEDLFAITTRMIVKCDTIGQNRVLYNFYSKGTTYVGSSVSGNRILYSLSDRIILFEWTGKEIIKIKEIQSKIIGQVFTDSRGRFWICSKNLGAICFNNLNKDLSNPLVYLPNEKILAMNEDKQGTLWFCTAGKGVFALPQNTPSIYIYKNKLSSLNITALYLDKKGRIWSGNDEGELYTLHNKDFLPQFDISINGYNRCRQIIELPGNEYWIANDDRLRKISNKKITIALPTLSAFKSLILNNNRLWYVCYSHIGFLTPNAETVENRYQTKRFTTVGSDFYNNIWAGSSDGLYCTRDNMSKNWADLFPQLGSRVIAISPADSNHLWVVTASTGLLYVGIYDGSVTSVSAINTRLEEPIQNIQSISTTSSGQLWMATNNGVYGLEKDWTLHHYDYHDGLPANDVNAVVAQEDTLWVGTVAGLGRFVLPSGQKTGNFASLITALRYRKSNSLILYNLLDSTISPRFTQLPPNARVIEFDLGALDFCSRRNLKFECLLEENLTAWYYWTPENLLNWVSQGFRSRTDTSWSSNGTLNLGVQLSPGLYNIRITALSTTGQYSNQPSNWTVLMTPQWYQTVWVFLALWAFLAWGIWMYFRIRSMNREFGMKVAQLQLQTLQSQISPHFIGNSINAIQKFFYPFNIDKATKYVSLFTHMLRQTINFSDDTFILAKDEMIYIRDYLIMNSMRFGDRFKFEISGASQIPDLVRFPVMFLQPLIENATAHGISPKGESILQVHFAYDSQTVKCTILDNGLGIRSTMEQKKNYSTKRKSKGLLIISKKIRVLNQIYPNLNLTCTITDRQDDHPPARGTRVEVSFNSI